MTQALGITDGSAGMNAQVRALAEALGVELTMKTVRMNAPWRFLPNVFFDWGLHHLLPIALPDVANVPELVMSCGRKGALAAAFLRKKRGQGARFIHIQDPQMSPKNFDLVIAMEHDRIRAANVHTIPCALHAITPEKLAQAAHHWQPKFEHLPRPWKAVLIGGSTNRYRFTGRAMDHLIADIEKIEGSLLITSSRRTGEENIARLNAFGHRAHPRMFLYTGEVENPYMGMLACADEIYVTNDSVNMMTEALATGKPVHVLSLLGHKGTKPARFAGKLSELKPVVPGVMAELAHTVRQVLTTRP